MYDMLRGYGLLLRLVADLIGLRGDEVDKLRAAVDHQFPGIVCHADVGERLLDHLVDGSPGDGEVVVVTRRRGHPRRHRPPRAAPPRSRALERVGTGKVKREATRPGSAPGEGHEEQRASSCRRGAGTRGREAPLGLRAPLAAAPATAATATSSGAPAPPPYERSERRRALEHRRGTTPSSRAAAPAKAAARRKRTLYGLDLRGAPLPPEVGTRFRRPAPPPHPASTGSAGGARPCHVRAARCPALLEAGRGAAAGIGREQETCRCGTEGRGERAWSDFGFLVVFSTLNDSRILL